MKYISNYMKLIVKYGNVKWTMKYIYIYIYIYIMQGVPEQLFLKQCRDSWGTQVCGIVHHICGKHNFFLILTMTPMPKNSIIIQTIRIQKNFFKNYNCISMWHTALSIPHIWYTIPPPKIRSLSEASHWRLWKDFFQIWIVTYHGSVECFI